MRIIAIMAISICSLVNAGFLTDISVFDQSFALAASMICGVGMVYVLAKA